MKLLLSIAVGLLMSIASAFSQTSIRMIVHEESKPCRRMIEQTCLQVQKDGSTEWELFYDPIKGFEFEPGYRYEIVVIRTNRPEPVPQDLSRYLYTLDKIITKTPVLGQEMKQPANDAKQPVNRWKVVALNGQQLNTEDLYFELTDNRTGITGKNGCNQFNMTVSFNKKGSKVTIRNFSTTEMACPDGNSELENQFITAITDKKFKLTSANGQWIWKRKRKVVLVLEQFPEEYIATTDPMTTTVWNYFNGKNLKVIQLNGNQLKNSRAALQFDTENHHFSGNNGCNQVSGTYTLDGNSIRFSDIVSTKMACIGDEVQLVEREMQAVLATKGLTLDFAEQVMNLYDASGRLIAMLAIDESK